VDLEDLYGEELAGADAGAGTCARAGAGAAARLLWREQIGAAVNCITVHGDLVAAASRCHTEYS
jgi:hypothetical protein